MLRGFRLLARSVGPALPLGLALGLVLACAACAPRVQLPRFEDAASNHAAFQQRFVAPPVTASGVAVRASLLYSTRERSNRTDVQIFGDYALPLRLDVRAGFGTMLALMREDASGLLAFYPEKSKAYAHTDPVIGAQLLGMPFPFSLRDLALVLSGHFGTLVPAGVVPAAIRALPDGGFAYSYSSGPVRLLAVDAYGRPQRMEGQLSRYFKTQAEREGEVVSGPREWSLVFSDFPEDDGDPEGPAQVLTLGLPKGESAELFAVIAALPSDISVLFIEHDMNLVFRFASHIIVLVAGRILMEAGPEVIRTDQRVRDVYLGKAHHG